MTKPEAPLPSRRRERIVGRAVLGAGTLFAFAIVLMVNFLAYRNYTSWDWTSQGLFTLSNRTAEVLRGLPGKVDVYLLLSRGEQNFSDVRDLLDRYAARSSKFVVHVVDPDREPAQFRVLAQRHGFGAAQLESGEVVADIAAVLTYGEKKWTITRDDLIGLDIGSLDDDEGPNLEVKAEQALTGALVQLTSGRASKVCVTRGHGEWEVDSVGERTLAPLKDELRRNNVEMEAVDLQGQTALRERCDAMFVIGPIRAFTDTEATTLKAYVEAGGNLLLALDPIIEQDQFRPTGLEAMTESFGIRLGQDLIIERDRTRLIMPNPLEAFLVTSYGEHPTTKQLKMIGGVCLFFRLARSVTPVDQRLELHTLLETSAEAYAETRLGDLVEGQEPVKGEGDVDGPVPLAVAYQRVARTDDGISDGRAQRGGRLVVVGDADWMMGELLDAPQFANFDLASMWSGWLTDREALISLPPKRVRATPLSMDQRALATVFFQILVLMPLAVIFFGVGMWWQRRS